MKTKKILETKNKFGLILGVDVESRIIGKRTFTSANVHDSVEMEKVVSEDEKSIWTDRVYANKKYKKAARSMRDILWGFTQKNYFEEVKLYFSKNPNEDLGFVTI